MLQRREHVGDIGQLVLRPGLQNEGEVVGPLAAADRGLPFAVAPVEHQHRFACGKPQHVAEIVALVAVERDGFARLEGVIDEQARGAKVQLRHVNVPSSAAF